MSATWIALAAYALGLLAIGVLAGRRAERSLQEYYLAGGGLSSFVLFMALFGTNVTPFLLIGISGIAYHQGLGIFGLNGAIVTLGLPIIFWTVGVPARRLAIQLKAMTPAEIYSKRLGSVWVGLLLFGLWTLYTLPYMATALEGAGVTLNQATEGQVPEVAGAVGVLLLALVYTTMGGMRATAWTNVVQGGLFLGFVVLAFWFHADGVSGGRGVTGALERLHSERPDLCVAGEHPLLEPRAFTSWSLAISLTVIGFPHMLVRLFTARSERSMLQICRVYPIALLFLWLPAVLCGVFGALAFPGLEGKASDRVFTLMAQEYLPPWLAGLAFLAVLAAVMSTLDAQLLTLGSMLSRDVLPTRRTPRAEILATRGFALLVAVATFLLWRYGGASVFAFASVAFSGYVTLVPTLFLGVRWKRFTATGALASLVAGTGVYAAALASAGGFDSAVRASWLGFLPAFWGLVAAVAGALVGTALSAPREPAGRPAAPPVP